MMSSSPRQSSIVQTVFSVELDHQPLLQIVGVLPHDLGIRVLKNVVSSNFDMALARQYPKSGLRPEVNQFTSEIPFVLWDVLV